MFALARRFRSTFVFAALASALVLADSAHQHRGLNHGHHHLTINRTEPEGHVQKRFDGTRFTYFEVGQNACGSFDHDSDFIVALNTHQWNGGSNCYAQITVSYQGKSAQAKITDECMECPYGAIDLSPGLFQFLVPGGLDAGEVYGSWVFGSGDAPTTTEAPPPPPTTTKHSSTPTPTSTTPTTTHHSTTSQTTTSTTPSSTSTTSTSTSSAPTATVTSWDSGMLNQFNLALIQLVDLSNAILGSPSGAQ